MKNLNMGNKSVSVLVSNLINLAKICWKNIYRSHATTDYRCLEDRSLNLSTETIEKNYMVQHGPKDARG